MFGNITKTTGKSYTLFRQSGEIFMVIIMNKSCGREKYKN
jgi:hypothetical protein